MARKKTPTKNSKPKKPEPAEPVAELCEFVKYDQQKIHRRKIKKLPYNPRYIEPENRARLRANLDVKSGGKGLLEALTWNKRTGNLVSGHQRIGIIDSLMQTDNYLLPMNVVDLNEKEEKEQCIFFNNQEAQGAWSLELLGPLFTGPDKLDPEATGFTPATIYQLFGDAPMVEQPEQLEVLAAQMREARERYNKIKEVCGKRDDFDYYLVVFASNEDRGAFLDSVGLPNNRFVDGSQLAGRVLTLGGWAFQPAADQDKPGKHSITYCFENAIELAAFREDARLPEGTRVVDVKREG